MTPNLRRALTRYKNASIHLALKGTQLPEYHAAIEKEFEMAEAGMWKSINSHIEYVTKQKPNEQKRLQKIKYKL